MYIAPLFETLSPDLHMERIARAERSRVVRAPEDATSQAWTSFTETVYRRLMTLNLRTGQLSSAD